MPSTPVHILRRGMLTVRVFRRSTNGCVRHSVTLTRSFRDGDTWKESRRFGRDDIPLARRLLDEAHSWMLLQNQLSPEKTQR